MKLRSFLLVLILALSGTAFAQDKIYKRNGDVIDAKIKTVAVKTITYVRFDNQTGPEYTIIKNEVEKIVYQNGSEEEFGGRRDPRISRHDKDVDNKDAEPGDKKNYKPNIVSVAPLQFTENGLGFGFSYEHALDPKGILSFYLPVAVTFDLNNGTYYNQAAGAYQNGPQDAMFYAMPGIKVYPTGAFGTVRYSLGPSLVIGTGQKSTQTYDPYGTASSFVTQDHLVLGMIINNTLNINANAHISLGLELGFGFTYLNRVGGLNQGTEGLVQGGFKIGYRF